MFDNHHIWNAENWWILPYFNVFWIHISTYSFFVLLWLIVWIYIFWLLWKKDYSKNENSFYVIFFWILWWSLWAKIPIWIAYFNEIKQAWNIESILSGRTITWWLIWWFIAIWITKKVLKEKTRFGNAIAPWAAIWIAIWRIGCFLHWCCYWEQTNLPWWVNFWDWLYRHPTQIYEIIFLIILAIILISLQKKKLRPWILFDYFLISYFWFRFLIEFIRVEPKVFYWFSLYQIASIFVVIFVLIKMKLYKKN
jgi:prolipoprotein diacylglyceryltransferase